MKRLWFSLILLVYLSEDGQAYFDDRYQISRPYLQLENFLDIKAYQPPIQWERDYWAADAGFSGSVGSLSMERFYLKYDLKLDQELSETTGFSYRYQEEQIYESNPAQQEFGFRLGSSWRFDLYGRPAHDKRFGGLGLGFGYGKPQGPQYVRLGRLYQNPLYNQKSTPSDDGPITSEAVETPTEDRFLGHSFGPNHFIWFDFSLMRPSQLRQLDSGRTYFHQGFKAQGRAEGGRELVWGFWGRLEEQRRREQQSGNPAQSQKIELGWADIYLRQTWGPLNLTLGAQRATFRNHIEAEDLAEQYLHHLETDLVYTHLEWAQTPGSTWILGLISGPAWTQKQFAEVFKNSEEQSQQTKANIGLVLHQSNRWRLYFNTSWDLDHPYPRPWDGGNLMAELLF
ncbi:MAG: hypothetical protein A2527_04660 [Candidatus Lambdaproteobacteria bacterium RIFOXYD2_FULL_50_16]|uniref:Uncharacterized protein n=1 Tax=Candidatus Lambdaproteobacteria bacterium RIFOXYD2_FULL_50_16 TaxID=1817772 RepID=A0A1F6GDK8_9PROT|nr:MAG: hypothetical protein A2527_04660 [Candidatus Lambdaproteobacteria bacterium RIFOXYD2_FULL_50_16]